MRIAETPMASRLFSGPKAWTAEDYSPSGEWITQLDAATIEALIRAAKGKTAEAITGAEMASPEAGALVRHCRQELLDGRGFVLLRGLPVDCMTGEQACALYVGLGRMLGATLPQNVRMELLYAVRDEGYSIEKQWGATGVRFSKTAQAVNFHTDSAPALLGATPDVVGLLALRTARQGGASALVSAYSIHNALLREHPEHLERLYRSFHFDRRAEARPGEPLTLEAPVFTYSDAAGLSMRYFRFYIPKGHELAGLPLAEAEVQALDAIDRIAERPGLQVVFAMQPGDIQLVSNTAVLHSRTAFEDHPEPERRRHLKRLWLAVR